MLLPRRAYRNRASHLSTFSARPEAFGRLPLAPAQPSARPRSRSAGFHWLHRPSLALMCQFESLRRRVVAERTGSPRESGKWGRRARGAGGERSRPERAGQRPPPSRSARVRAVGLVGGRMELNSLLILLEAAEYLERRDRGSARAPLCAGPRAGGRRRGRGRGGGPLTAPSVRRGRARLRLGAALRRRLRQEENKGGRPGAQSPEQQVPPPARLPPPRPDTRGLRPRSALPSPGPSP